MAALLLPPIEHYEQVMQENESLKTMIEDLNAELQRKEDELQEMHQKYTVLMANTQRLSARLSALHLPTTSPMRHSCSGGTMLMPPTIRLSAAYMKSIPISITPISTGVTATTTTTTTTTSTSTTTTTSPLQIRINTKTPTPIVESMSPTEEFPADFCFIDTNYRDTLTRATEPGQIIIAAADDNKHDDSQSAAESDDVDPSDDVEGSNDNGSGSRMEHRHSVSQPLISIPRIPTHRLNALSIHRHDDRMDIWRALCGSDSLSGALSFGSLYPVLCRVFIEITGCARVPRIDDLQPFAFKNTGDQRDDSKVDGDGLQWEEWRRFWPWFIECSEIVKELSFLWDCSNSNLYLCNLFCGRTESRRILEKLPAETFIVRLASIRGGVVISYFESDSRGRRKKMKHVLCSRKGPNKYQKKRNIGSRSQQLVSLSKIIRSSDRIKTIYTQKGLFPKKTVF